MNKILKITFVLLFSLTFFACSEDESQLNNENSVLAEKELFKKLEQKYGISNINKNNGNYSVIYNDGSKLEIKQLTETSFVASGTKILDSEFGYKVNIEEENFNLEFFNDDFSHKYSISEFSNNIDKFSLLKRPCDEHPEGSGENGEETFKECYEREKDEFCDGFWSCLALDTNPAVVILIALHCELC